MKTYLDKEGYPCKGHDCYDRGNWHFTCSACPMIYDDWHLPKPDDIRKEPPPEPQFWEG